MKKIFLMAAISAAVFCVPFFGLSQYNNNLGNYEPQESSDKLIAFLSANNSPDLRLNDVNLKAVRDFTRKFKNAGNAKWYQTSEAFVAQFNSEGIETKVIYDLNGNWHSMLRTYSEDKLLFDVRHIVKSKYYDYDIMVVYEITHPDNLTYILKIEDSKRIKTLRVGDGEMEVIGDYIRG